MTLRSIISTLLAVASAAALQGCIARTAAAIVTAPVKVVGGAVDMATTSQSEADEKRGRELRKQDRRYGELTRSYQKDSRKCESGDRAACERAAAAQREIDAIGGRSAYPAPTY